jgi:hypothetical protein
MTFFPIPTFRISLKQFHEQLVAIGLPPVLVRVRLADQLRSGEIETEPSLAGVVTQFVPASGGDMIETLDGVLHDPAHFIITKYQSPQDKLFVPGTATMAPDGTITIKPGWSEPVAANDAAVEPVAPTSSSPEPVAEPDSGPDTSEIPDVDNLTRMKTTVDEFDEYCTDNPHLQKEQVRETLFRKYGSVSAEAFRKKLIRYRAHLKRSPH